MCNMPAGNTGVVSVRCGHYSFTTLDSGFPKSNTGITPAAAAAARQYPMTQ